MATEESATEALRKRLGRNMALYRRGLGLTQDQLAEQLGLALETVSRIERGVTLPSISTLLDIAGRLNVTVAALLAEDIPSLRAQEQQLLQCLEDLPEDKRQFVVEHLVGLCRMLREP
jgi:transcriptional regulator with XRE-family HTH domain